MKRITCSDCDFTSIYEAVVEDHFDKTHRLTHNETEPNWQQAFEKERALRFQLEYQINQMKDALIGINDGVAWRSERCHKVTLTLEDMRDMAGESLAELSQLEGGGKCQD